MIASATLQLVMAFELKRKKGDGGTKCICGKPDSDVMIKCSINSCESWWHTECAGIKGATAGACKKITFVCPCCTVKRFANDLEFSNANHINTDELITEIKQGIANCLPDMVKDAMKTIQPDSDSLKTNMKTTFAEIMLEQQQSEKPITKNMIKEALTEGKREQQKVDERKKNIMVFNAPESAADNNDQCHKEDIELFYDICNEIDDSILINNHEVVKLRRFGTKESGKKRPMMVTVQTERAKRKLFSNLYKLESIEMYKDIQFNHDMTPEEKKAKKSLIENAKKKTAELQADNTLTSDEKNWMFLVRGPPWEHRMVKVRPRQIVTAEE